MSVYINDFEVKTESSSPPASAEGATGNEAGGAAPSGPTPRDVRRIVMRHEERCRRVWAH